MACIYGETSEIEEVSWVMCLYTPSQCLESPAFDFIIGSQQLSKFLGNCTNYFMGGVLTEHAQYVLV